MERNVKCLLLKINIVLTLLLLVSMTVGIFSNPGIFLMALILNQPSRFKLFSSISMTSGGCFSAKACARSSWSALSA